MRPSSPPLALATKRCEAALDKKEEEKKEDFWRRRREKKGNNLVVVEDAKTTQTLTTSFRSTKSIR